MCTSLTTVMTSDDVTPDPSRAAQVMVAVPVPTAVTVPEESTMATLSFEEDQTTLLSAASTGATSAVSTRVCVASILNAVRLSVMEDTGTLTLTEHVALTPPARTVTLAWPAPTALSRPFASTVTTEASEVLQVGTSVASVGCTVALSCAVAPRNRETSVWESVTAAAGTEASLNVAPYAVANCSAELPRSPTTVRRAR